MLKCTDAGIIPVVFYPTDLNFDGKVNIQDVTIVAVAHNSHPNDRNWNVLADLDRNSVVSIVDVTLVAKDYGKTVQLLSYRRWFRKQ